MITRKKKKIWISKNYSEDLKELGFASTDELATALSEGKATLSKLKPLTPWFALAPPRLGFKRSRIYGARSSRTK